MKFESPAWHVVETLKGVASLKILVHWGCVRKEGDTGLFLSSFASGEEVSSFVPLGAPQHDVPTHHSLRATGPIDHRLKPLKP